jgi:hypothetical protein
MSRGYSSSVETIGSSSEPDIVYYNADIVADAYDVNQLGLGKDPAIRFQETRSTPLITDISKYMFSIIRFTMDGAGKDLPMFIPNINDTQPDINLTTYSITYDYTVYFKHPSTGVDSTRTFTTRRFVNYQPETVNAPLPNPPDTVILPEQIYAGQDLRGNYYYVYTYQHWVDLVNVAFAGAWNDTLPAVPDTYHPTLSIQQQWNAYWLTLVGATVENQPPLHGSPVQMIYNIDNGLFSLLGNIYCCGDDPIQGNSPPQYQAWSWNNGTPVYASSGALEQGVHQGTELMKVYFNTDMFGLFANCNNFYFGNESTGKVNQILFQSLDGGKNTTALSAPDAFSDTIGSNPKIVVGSQLYWVIEQNYNSTSTLWSPISSIVFSSTMIPIFPEQTGTPLTYGQGNNASPVESSSAFTPIITDISVPMNRADEYRGFLSYTPTGEYRLSSFTGSKTELRNIDIQVFWKNRLDNKLYPINMFNQTNVSIKMMFRKK